MKMTESVMQSVIMRYALDRKNHQLAIPNITTMYNWESDLVSVTRADLVHEYEIKLTISDYKRDFTHKKRKHLFIENPAYHKPNYFWYVTYQIEIEPPNYAGWMTIDDNLRISVRREAPRLHTNKIKQSDKMDIGRLLSYRLKNVYKQTYIEGWYKEKHSQR